MNTEDTARKRVIETSPFIKGNIADVLPESILRGIFERWVPEMKGVDLVREGGEVFLEHGWESGYIADFLTNELIWATENNGMGITVSQQRKWNLLYTIECLSLCHVSSVLTWTASADGVVPQTETVPWRKGPFRSWYDLDIEPVGPDNLHEKLDLFKTPLYPRYTDDPSRYSLPKDPDLIGLAMAESLATSTGLSERLSMFGDQLPVRPFNDRGIGKWGGIPTFATPFEADSPSLSDSPLISEIRYRPECIKAAISAFASKRKEIEEMYAFIMDSMAAFVKETTDPPRMPQEGSYNSEDERIRQLIDFRKSEKCRRFASFYRFVDMDLWKNFDYIMKTYRVQDESQYTLPSDNTGQEGSFAEINPSESLPKTGNKKIKINGQLSQSLKETPAVSGAEILDDMIEERITVCKNDRNYDTKAAPVIWSSFNEQKRVVIRDLAIKTLCDLKRQYGDMRAELEAAEDCVSRKAWSLDEFEEARLDAGIRLNSRIPTQRFMKVDVLVPLIASDVAVSFNRDSMSRAVSKMLDCGLRRALEIPKSDFSVKEQEDHLRGAALSLHTMVCMAVDALEGRSVLEDWAADIYSSIQEHTMNDALLPREKDSAAMKDLLADRRKMKNHRFVNFSKVREAVKTDRYGGKYSKDGITTFGEWNQIEQMIPSPNFRPFVERADGLSFRDLIKFGLSGTPLQNGLTRDNARYVMAPRITKWRLRSSLKDLAEKVRQETVGGDTGQLMAHIGDSRKLNDARRGVLEFILSFCDEFAQNAHKTKMDVFNDPETGEALDSARDLNVRQKLLKTASETWLLSGSGLYVKGRTPHTADMSLFRNARGYVSGNIDEEGSLKKNTAVSGGIPDPESSLSRLALFSYSKDLTSLPEAVRLGLFPADAFLAENLAAVEKVFRSSGSSPQGSIYPGFFTEFCGNMIKGNSQYMPLLRSLSPARNPLTGTWNYNPRADQRDLNRIFFYTDMFDRRSAAEFPPRLITSMFTALPTGLEKCAFISGQRLYEVSVDNLMRLAWNGDDAIRGARAFHDTARREVMGFWDSCSQMTINPYHHMQTGGIRKFINTPLFRKGIMYRGRPVDGDDSDNRIKVFNEWSLKKTRALFMKVPTVEEEKLEYDMAYTIAPWTRDLYIEKQRVLKYSPLNPDYLFTASYAPIRRSNTRLLVNQQGRENCPDHFGMSSYGYGRGMDSLRKNEINPVFRLTDSGQKKYDGGFYEGERIMLPSDMLAEEAVRTINADRDMSGKYAEIRSILAKECIIARSGNNREDRSIESARMRCLMQDIGWTVKRMRDRNAELPKTVMSAAAMDPLFRIGEPEITCSRMSESVREAELASLMRKALWGEDFCNIRRHLATANRRFFEQQTKPGGGSGKIGARYAYQYELLRNMDFLKLRYEAGAAVMMQPKLDPARPDMQHLLYDRNDMRLPGPQWRHPAKDTQWDFLDALQQNPASLSVKGILRDCFRDIPYRDWTGFDGTNLLRTLAFSADQVLSDENRKNTLLIYPGSPEYPKYSHGMEFYRSNIPYGEFMGWAYDAFDPDRYNMVFHIEKFLGRVSNKNSGLAKKTNAARDFYSNYRPDSNGYGIRGMEQTIYGTEGFTRETDRIMFKDDTGSHLYTPDKFQKVRPELEKMLADTFRKTAAEKYINAVKSLEPMEGAITKGTTPFLWEAMQSDLIKRLFLVDVKRKESRRDYYPSMDEISVLGRAFETGLRACCAEIGARTSEKVNIPTVQTLTDTPPSWADI